MASAGPSSAPAEGKSLLERTLKLLIAGVFILIVVWGAGNILNELSSSARDSKLQNDFKELHKAIDGYYLKNAKLYEEWDPEKLSGQTLETVPKDPGGKPYVFDWFYQKLIYVGPDGILQTAVPGQRAD